ncbi:Creatinase/aminopeptidase [Schizopora paradoxa]|uniref:Creatinase/aminopeptidase n=1 Tax=Schizopora paradoxa TaxID=27342 RepID=A0A0H2RR05_9AGAM|nr:Creatinase/aminopeptidase [Schizopora paradoxa]
MRGLSAVRPATSRIFSGISTWIHRSHFERNSILPSNRHFTSSADMGVGAQKVDTTQRLTALRELMRNQSPAVDAYVVPSEDAHFSEYPSECDKRRAFISGFTGSAGCAVVTTEKAYLFTDGRYHLQASQELDTNWTLMKEGLTDVPSWKDFLTKHLEKKKKIAIDPTLITATDAKNLKESLKKRDSELVSVVSNLVDSVWGKDRPSPLKHAIHPLDNKFSGRSIEEKLKLVREQLTKRKVSGTVVSMLDEVAWLFNLRGSDIEYNPVFLSYAIATHDKAILFVDGSQVNDAVLKHLGSQVEIKPYEDVFKFLKDTSAKMQNVGEEEKYLVGKTTSLALANALGTDNIKITTSSSIVNDLKAIKNETEVEGFRQSHIRDGSALARYFAWLEEQLKNGVSLTESEAADVLEKYRSQLQYFKGLSFPTISSAGPNGAIIHYQPDPNNCATIRKDQIYLCDSGAQFEDGTTDVTRTWHFGTPTDEEKRAFTRVLQGHIAIDSLVFPNGTSGFKVDAVARMPLWSDGLDYRHGTGHGVGHFLNVHEGPHGIGVRIEYNDTSLKSGMTVSNEPGYYKDGHFGIRIENIVIVREAKTPYNFGDKGYLCFEHVTMCPIQTKLIAQDLLSPSERKWINSYHAEVFEKVSPLLTNDDRALKWLKKECAEI